MSYALFAFLSSSFLKKNITTDIHHLALDCDQLVKTNILVQNIIESRKCLPCQVELNLGAVAYAFNSVLTIFYHILSLGTKAIVSSPHFGWYKTISSTH